MRKHPFCLCFFPLYFFICSTSAGQDRVAANIPIITAAYQANRDSLIYFRCRFSVREARASDVATALLGKAKSLNSFEVLYIVDNDKEMYAIECPDGWKDVVNEGLKRKKSETKVPCVPISFLTNETYSLDFSPAIDAGNIARSIGAAKGPELTPFNLVGFLGRGERLSPTNLLKHALDDPSSQVQYTLRKLENRTYDCVTFPKTSTTPGYEFLFDKQNDYIIKRLAVFSNHLAGVAFVQVLESKKIGDISIPWKIASIVQEDPNQFSVRYLEINLFELRQPAAEEFAIVLPKNTRVLNPDNSLSAILVPKDKHIGLLDLEKLYLRAEEAAKIRAQANSADEILYDQIDEAVVPNRSNNWIIVLASTCFVVIVSILIYRNGRRRSIETIND
jgi:hypothetical protein